ncbi:MAG: SIMPL domain-containing protein [Anaerolineae bacterium]|jgi:uncharacterized protein YggE|nr:SIMPL domain-containing protein [Anaerolineae bacterium]
MSKKIFWTFLAVAALAAALLVPMAPDPIAAQEPAADDDQRRTVTVSGTGQISASPDLVVIRVGVETQAEEAAAALADNSEQMQELIDALQEAGVPEDNIQTRAVSLFPIYEQPRPEVSQPVTQTAQIIAFQATNIVEVRSEDMEGFGELLDTTVQAGGNRIEGIRFEVSDATPLLDQARQAAWDDALHKAEQLAEIAGLQLGEVWSITEISRTPRPVGDVDAGVGRQVESAVPIEPGTQTLELDISVTWLLEPGESE